MTTMVAGNLFSQATQSKTASENQTTTLNKNDRAQEKTKAVTQTKSSKVKKSNKNVTQSKNSKYKRRCCSAHSSKSRDGSSVDHINNRKRRDKRKGQLNYKLKNNQ